MFIQKELPARLMTRCPRFAARFKPPIFKLQFALRIWAALQKFQFKYFSPNLNFKISYLQFANSNSVSRGQVLG